MNVSRRNEKTYEQPTPECPTVNNIENTHMAEINIFKTLIRIMKQSYKIPDKLLDDQKKIILSKQLIREIISQLLHIPEHDIINNSSALSEEGCCGFSSLIEDIDDIKIKIQSGSTCCYRSFEIFYNEMYNKIPEEYNISLNKVINVRSN